MHLLMLLFTSLYFSDPSGSNLFFLSSILLSHRSRISAVIQDFSFLTMFAKDLTGCFSHCCVESVPLYRWWKLFPGIVSQRSFAGQKSSFRKRYSRLECMKSGNWSKRSYDVLQTRRNHCTKNIIWSHNGSEWLNKEKETRNNIVV